MTTYTFLTEIEEKLKKYMRPQGQGRAAKNEEASTFLLSSSCSIASSKQGARRQKWKCKRGIDVSTNLYALWISWFPGSRRFI